MFLAWRIGSSFFVELVIDCAGSRARLPSELAFLPVSESVEGGGFSLCLVNKIDYFRARKQRIYWLSGLESNQFC